MAVLRKVITQLCLVWLGVSYLPAQSGDWRTEINKERVLVFDGADTVAGYQIATRSLPDGSYARANYLHPVYAPDGSLLTEDFPADHRHHRGVFWTWHQIYAGDRRAGDAWECRNFTWRVADVHTQRRARRLHLFATVTWESVLAKDEAPVALARERVEIVFYPVRQGQRRVDFSIIIQPLVAELSIGGSEDAKGYGGFSWRLPLPEDVAFYSRDRLLEPRETAVTAGRELEITGTFANGFRQLRLRQVRQPGGLVPWILRSQSSMQNVAFPGRERYLIPARGIRLAYRLYL